MAEARGATWDNGRMPRGAGHTPPKPSPRRPLAMAHPMDDAREDDGSAMLKAMATADGGGDGSGDSGGGTERAGVGCRQARFLLSSTEVTPRAGRAPRARDPRQFAVTLATFVCLVCASVEYIRHIGTNIRRFSRAVIQSQRTGRMWLKMLAARRGGRGGSYE